MQQDPEPAGSPGPQQDPALPHSPSMPPPESLSEGHQSSHSDSPTEQATEEEFQFLRCQGCRAEAKCPKLLPCLHTLCSGCLEESSMQCPVCRAPWPSGAGTQALDNVFFESLQRRLSVYQQIAREQAFCTRCKEPAHYWCFECEQLICTKCFEAHQWFLKHEARPLAELRSQSVREFLDGTRKSNIIFCSNPNHRSPMLTSIYCRGCSKPLCCSCALLDRGHSELKCDISMEIQQRQDELDTMTQDLQEQDRTFGAAQAQMRSAISQLGRVRADTEEFIRERVREVVAHVLEQERELLQGVGARYQRDYEEIAGQLGRLDAVLQRIRMGSVLVQRMKLYASDQEVLDMHDFLRKALHQLRQEEPQSLRATVHTDSFDEFRVRLQDLVSCITRGTDAALSRRASPEAASTPRDTCGTDPEGSNTTTPQKRKACQTECPRKAVKMESEEGEESRLAWSSPEQPRPSTSRAVSPPHLDGPPSPKSPIIRDELSLPESNHQTGDPAETEERVVVISSSEDSDAENPDSRELADNSSESSDLQLEGPSSLGVLDDSPSNSLVEDKPLVFFDLKIDNETQKISQLAAVNQESQFRALIQPEVLNVYSKAVSLEVGLQHFLHFLASMRQPILACYKLWGPSLPSFFQALEEMNMLGKFQKSISGFLATLPLIRECVPGASSFKLKSLAKTYLARNMSERSALAAVLTMRDLCRLLEVSPSPQLALHVHPFSSLQCFSSLQPLVRAAILPRAEARLLALHKVTFIELLTAHHHDPQGGLRKYNRFLSLQSPTSSQPAFDLHSLGTYFEGLLGAPASAGAGGVAAPPAGHSLAERATQQT
uniref:Protein PML n=1 Tax=Bos indicus x Bos taurus TaxID=30522 RepID=A0A4W2FC79_BOBOX